jgi:hypothetical protein
MKHALVDPRGALGPHARAGLAPRFGAIPEDIEIGFLVNEVSRQTGPDFTRYTEVLEDLLRHRHRHRRVVVVRDAKPVLSRPAEPSLLHKYRHCRGVVTGLAK